MLSQLALAYCLHQLLLIHEREMCRDRRHQQYLAIYQVEFTRSILWQMNAHANRTQNTAPKKNVTGVLGTAPISATEIGILRVPVECQPQTSSSKPPLKARRVLFLLLLK